MTGVDLWVGRYIFNTTLGEYETYTGSAWVPANTSIQVLSSSAISALSGAQLFTGRLAFNTDTQQVNRYTGSTWLPVGSYVETMTSTQRAALSGAQLFVGREIYDTTVGHLFIYAGSAWLYDGPQKAQGSYTGSGSDKAIAVGFAPDLVIVAPPAGNAYAATAWITRTDTAATNGFSYYNSGVQLFSAGYLTLTGFVATGATNSLSTSGYTYYWTAFKFS